MSTKQGESAYGYSSETDHLVEFNETAPKKTHHNCRCYGSVVLLAILALAIVVGAGVGLGLKFGPAKSNTLPSKITATNLMSHLQDLEDIADSQEVFSRAVQYGYNDSADMVFHTLEEAGFEVKKQHFTVATYEEKSESSFSVTVTTKDVDYTFEFLRGSQYYVMRYSNTTDGMEITANLSVVQESCNPGNYTANTIALIDYVINETEAGCSLLNMTEAAAEAEALGIVMMRTEEDPNNADPPTTRVYEQDGDSFRVAAVPVLGATYSLGKQLLDYIDLSDTGTVQVSLSTDTDINFWWTYNVLAYTPDFEKNDSMIVFGSHLDSVPAGPGINDNGSGSAANLEIALQMIKNAMIPINKVLFAFWGAEELGLLGSTYFVSQLSEEMRANIALNLNFDMIGSPNYIRQIYNGSGAENEKIVQASEKIQLVFQEYFESQDLNYTLKSFDGRSDYGPFIEEGIDIPAGGLATGADETKSEMDRKEYGGLANAILDPCYHQACDTVDNIDQEVYLQMSQAAAYTLNELMMKENLKEYLNS